MEPTVLAGMIFSLLVIMMIGGFILLFPISRRLGKLLERRLEERNGGAAIDPRALEQLHRAVAALDERVDDLVHRQEFVENLLESRRSASLSAGDSPGSAP